MKIKVLIKKANKLNMELEDFMRSLQFQSLPETSKRDYYAAKDAYKTFLHNLPNPE